MTNFTEVKITPRDEQVLNLLVQGCSNKEIGDQLNISSRTVKQHLRMLFLRVGILKGGKRVKLARCVYGGDSHDPMRESQSNGKSDLDSCLGRVD
jgi:DNA-binding NarL/FixJ family response regulator